MLADPGRRREEGNYNCSIADDADGADDADTSRGHCKGTAVGFLGRRPLAQSKQIQSSGSGLRVFRDRLLQLRLQSQRQVAALVAALALTLGSVGHAQIVQPELRLDALGPPPFTIEPGVGLNLFLGNYVRAGADVGFNVRRHPTFTGGSWRGDLLARVTLDPFRQQRWGFSLGGGLSLRPHVVRLAAVVDLEGPQVGAVLPALQLGVSGGVRAGLILRRAVPRRR